MHHLVLTLLRFFMLSSLGLCKTWLSFFGAIQVLCGQLLILPSDSHPGKMASSYENFVKSNANVFSLRLQQSIFRLRWKCLQNAAYDVAVVWDDAIIDSRYHCVWSRRIRVRRTVPRSEENREKVWRLYGARVEGQAVDNFYFAGSPYRNNKENKDQTHISIHRGVRGTLSFSGERLDRLIKRLSFFLIPTGLLAFRSKMCKHEIINTTASRRKRWRRCDIWYESYCCKS